MTSVAATREEAASNVHLVATAVEQMTGTVAKIARNSEKVRTVTEEGVQN